MVRKGIGHKIMIWRNNGEMVILKIEQNDKYYTF